MRTKHLIFICLSHIVESNFNTIFDTHQSKLFIDLFKIQTSNIQTIILIVRRTNNHIEHLFGLNLTHTYIYIYISCNNINNNSLPIVGNTIKYYVHQTQ